MRTSRAFLASFGSTGSMLAAFACAFVLASAVVAFHGWPVSGALKDIGTLIVHDDSSVPWEVSGPQQVALDSRAAAGVVAPAAIGPVVTGGATGVAGARGGGGAAGGAPVNGL